MNLIVLLIIVLVVVALLGSPVTGWHSFGWGPSGGLGIVVVLLIVILLLRGGI
jgi:hypothetical protein